MITELIKIENLLFDSTNSKIINLVKDHESKEYLGYDFDVGKHKFKFRKSKITPRKVGQFVTLWKRNLNNITEPFSETDNFDFCIILTEENENYGFFLFPKKELIYRKILSTKLSEGKRGFRVYPKWVKTENKQAEKTQFWQSNYFFDFLSDSELTKNKILNIISL